MPRLCHLNQPLSVYQMMWWRPYNSVSRVRECIRHDVYPASRRMPVCTAYSTEPPCSQNRNNTVVNHSNCFGSRIESGSLYATIHSSSCTNQTKRYMSDEIRRGTDLLADSLAHGPHRKIILESYAPSGVDVKGLVQVGDIPDEGDRTGEDKIIHMNGSIVAFPNACFLWNVKHPDEVTLESLSVIQLYQPTVEYLFIGCDRPLPPRELAKIKKEFRKKDIVTEQMDIMNAMGTFNILNGEDRRVSCVLVIDPNDEG